jgi:TRAP-type mannitol/chloroaromatic compound transport system permease small subunit
MIPVLRRICRSIDWFSEWSGRLVCWLIIPLTLGTVYDVVLRYFFKSPTKWAYELTWMEYAAFFLLGGAFTLKNKNHVRVDILHNKMNERARAAVDSIVFLVFFVPVFFILIKHGIKYAWHSWEIKEHSYLSYWQPAVYPIKTVIPVAFCMLSLQAFSEFIKNLTYAIRNKPL